MTRTSIFLFIVCVSHVGLIFGQSEKAKLKDGNNYYKSGDFQKADSIYGSLTQGQFQEIASFNQGDAKFKNSDYDNAISNFSEVARNAGSEQLRADAYHNLGNTYMAKEEPQKAIDAYKNALRLRPNDEDTRHNLAAALKMMKQQQNQNEQNKDEKDQSEQNQNQENQDQENQDQENQGENQDQENQDQENQGENQDQENQDQENPGENDDQQNKGEDDKEQQPQPHQISPQDAQRMLESLNKGEKEIQAQLKKAKGKAQKKKIEKDW